MKQKESLEKILDKIQHKARQEAESIKEEVDAKLEKKKKKFEEEKKDYVEKETEEFHKEGKRKRTQLLAQAKLDARKELLKKKREMVESVYDQTVKKIRDMENEKKKKLMEKLFKEVVITGKEKVSPAKSNKAIDKGFITKINKKNNWDISLGKKENGLDGGMVLRGENFETVVDYGAMREYIKNNFEPEVVEELFEK